MTSLGVLQGRVLLHGSPAADRFLVRLLPRPLPFFAASPVIRRMMLSRASLCSATLRAFSSSRRASSFSASLSKSASSS